MLSELVNNFYPRHKSNGIRMWDENQKKMVYLNFGYQILKEGKGDLRACIYNARGANTFATSDFMLCLNDKLAELDIVEFKTIGDVERGVICFSQQKMAYMIRTVHRQAKAYQLNACRDIRVIGNVYANPELLDPHTDGPNANSSKKKVDIYVYVYRSSQDNRIHGGYVLKSGNTSKQEAVVFNEEQSNLYYNASLLSSAYSKLTEPCEISIHSASKEFNSALSNMIGSYTELDVPEPEGMEANGNDSLWHKLQADYFTVHGTPSVINEPSETFMKFIKGNRK